MSNRLYFGDNLEWLRDRREFPDARVDLVYLDPPFNSNANSRRWWVEKVIPRKAN
jgi:16S rRNA G966 N2-methylase RsmD